MKRRTCMLIIVVLTLLPLAAVAGQTDSPGDPTTTDGHMPTLQELYQYLTSGATPGAPQSFQEPIAGPGATMKTLQELYEDFKALLELCTVAPEHVLQGQTFFQTIGPWGPAAGTMPDHGAVTITPGTSAQPIAAGYHNGSGYVEGDADLVAGNIADGVEIFDVIGTGTVANDSPAPVEKTGQTTCYDLSGGEISCTGTGHDGDHQAGVAWPNPRFTDNSDGTVTDNLTGLIWLKNANCGGSRNWSNALTFANALYDGWTGDGSGGDCGLSDNSNAGDWRLPNVKELQSLIDYGRYNPALPGGHPFSGVQSSVYWSSATNEYYPNRAWVVNLNYGSLSLYAKSDLISVWPVRSGQ